MNNHLPTVAIFVFFLLLFIHYTLIIFINVIKSVLPARCYTHTNFNFTIIFINVIRSVLPARCYTHTNFNFTIQR